MNIDQIEFNNAVQFIIITRLEESIQEYLVGCKTAFQMMQRLKDPFY